VQAQAAKATSDPITTCQPTMRQGDTGGCSFRKARASAAVSRLNGNSLNVGSSNLETGAIIDISNYTQVTRDDCRKALHYT
jgi:hypothetical protein